MWIPKTPEKMETLLTLQGSSEIYNLTLYERSSCQWFARFMFDSFVGVTASAGLLPLQSSQTALIEVDASSENRSCSWFVKGC